MENLKPGTVVSHFRYGEGVILNSNLTSYDIIFERGGKLSMSKTNEDLELVRNSETDTDDNQPRISLTELEELMTYVLDKYNGISHNVPLGSKWSGGTMLLQPSNKALQPKEIPIESFFHKIVMLRDRLRVLEQNINSHQILTDEDKVHLQQYITKCYGSLTSFNILFAEKDDYFVGQKGD